MGMRNYWLGPCCIILMFDGLIHCSVAMIVLTMTPGSGGLGLATAATTTAMGK